ncbi:GOLD domain-containing protein [Strongyloides ratti]|uniref:GOLD domain-containing protein n=1 Tax=Strongyloides ratti TaxID=34506 RepID=A0A090L5F4_STRRB|nr:GOLD domain-containing protein [Strongyloides ratti]CEF64962.1 GOLD domain-containing protein [Strongyloides ratti]
MKIFILIITSILHLAWSDNHVYSYFRGTILVNKGNKECYYQEILDVMYKSLNIHYINYGKDINNVVYTLYLNETNQLDSVKNTNIFNTSYDIEKYGIGEYKICFEVNDSWRNNEPIFLKLSLVKKKVHNENSNNLKYQDILPNFDSSLDKITEKLDTIEMEQDDYVHHERRSRHNAEKIFEIVNYKGMNGTYNISITSDGDLEVGITILSNIQIGSIYLFLSLSLFILQIFTSLTFYKINKSKKNVTFKIMECHGILALVSLTCHMVTSIITIIKLQRNIYFETIIGSFLQTSYFGCVEIMFLLTLNRFDVMYGNIILSRIPREKLYQCIMIFCFLLMMPFLIIYIIPTSRLVYDFRSYEWLCLINHRILDVTCYVENKIILTLLATCFILHVFIFGKVIYLRCYTSKKSFLSFQDLKFVIHAVLCFASIAILELIWNNVLYFVYFTELTSLIPPVLAIIAAGSNAIFTICFVREIRKNILICFPKRKFVSTSVFIEKNRVTKY